MRVVNGMHVSNNRHWNIEQMLQAAKLRGAVTILHHLMFEHDDLAQQWGDQENAYWYNKLRWGWPPQGIPAAPERLIHVRMFHPNWRAVEPKVWAEHSVRMLSAWKNGAQTANLWEDPFVCVSACNEQNLEPYLATTPAEYDKMGKWQIDFWSEVDRLIPGRKALSCFGALASGHDAAADTPDSEYQVPAIKDAVQRVEIMATHPYGHMEWGAQGDKTLPGGSDAFWHMLRDFRPKGWRDTVQPGRPADPGGVRAQFPTKPLLISESGTFAHNDPARAPKTIQAMRGLLDACAADGKVLGVTWFIWNSDESHPTNVIWPNQPLRNALADLPEVATGMAVPVRTTPGPVDPGPGPGPTPDPTTAVFPAIKVNQGEGMFAVARRAYGDSDVARNARRIAEANGLGWPPVLRAGMVLTVPGFKVVREV